MSLILGLFDRDDIFGRHTGPGALFSAFGMLLIAKGFGSDGILTNDSGVAPSEARDSAPSWGP